ncbi:MAG: gliding motility-associated C-terminal domain-containing protein [Crocinitomicaceae bacterium]
MKKDINQLFKDALEGYEKPYNPKAWDNIKGKLPKSGMATVAPWLIGALSVAVITGVVYFATTPSDTTKLANKDIQETTQTTGNTNSTKTNTSTAPSSNNNSTTSNTNVPSVINSTSENMQNNATATPINQNTATSPTKTENNNAGNDLAASNKAGITKNNYVAPKIECSATKICSGSTTILTAKDVDSKYTIKWYTSTGEKFEGKSIEIKPKQTTEITAIVIDNVGEKHPAGVYTINVDAIDEPSISVKDDLKNTKPHYNLQVNTSKDELVSWNLNYKNTQGNRFDFYLTKQGVYPVNVTITNSLGCTKTFVKNIEQTNDYNLFAENTFTPNQGNNNTFIPKALLAREVNFKMSIMDRSGNVLYETTDTSAPWTGKSMNGDFAPQGTYLWVVTLINEEGMPEKYAGELLLMR